MTTSNDQERPLKRKTTEPAERTLDEEWYLDDGDVTLISSDGVAFKIHRYHLQAARYRDSSMNMCLTLIDSPVFRAMLNTCETTAEIELHDQVLESSNVLGQFCGFLYDGAVLHPRSPQQLPVMIAFHRFMIKYDAATTNHNWQNHVFRRVKGFGLFIMGAHTDQIEICAESIRKGGDLSWKTGGNNTEVDKVVEGANTLDVGSLSFEAFCLIPPMYLHALQRAISNTPVELKIKDGKRYWKAVGDEFESLIKAYPRKYPPLLVVSYCIAKTSRASGCSPLSRALISTIVTYGYRRLCILVQGE